MKKTIAVIFLLLLGATVMFCLLPVARPQVIGEVSPKDLVEIRRVISHEIWRGTLPDYSWHSFKHLPGTINARISNHLQRIEAYPGGIVRTTISTGKHRETTQLRPAYYDLILRNGPKGWEIVQQVGDIGPGALREF
jgi:hypothetical protein